MIQLPRDWIIQLIFTSMVLSILGFGFWLMYEPWSKLSQTYRSELPPPKVFLEQQSGILGQTRIKGYLNIGISERGLYLSHTPPLSYLIKPLLINWEAIARIEPTTEALWGNGYKIYLGRPTITTLILSEEIIRQVEYESGIQIIQQ